VKAYLETSVLVVYCFGEKLEPDRYKPVKTLFDKINSEKIKGIASFYSLHELFIFAIENFSPNIGRIIGKRALEEILRNKVELIPLLNREQRILYSHKMELNDASDIPHAILAFIEKCDCIITYDKHFDSINNIIKIMQPEELL